jgi:hypothetical protein
VSKQILFISDKEYINAKINGGVQLCTSEYLTYLKDAGFNVTQFLVEPNLNLKNRLKIKMDIEVYERYPIESYLKELIHQIDVMQIKLVLFNQVNLAAWAAKLKSHLPADVKFVALSHGNESGDFLHKTAKENRHGIIQTWRLGKMLVKESRMFSQLLDGIVVLSENEVYINQWLGAHKQLYLPRMLSPQFLEWQPIDNRIGFVGTLDHLPNRQGIKYLADELKQAGLNYKLRLVGAPSAIGHEIASQYSFVEYVGPLSDQELITEVKTWSVFLNPVFWYARGASTKLAQSINWGIPCITTPAGKRGYELYSEDIVSADSTPQSFVHKLIGTLDDQSYLKKIKKATEDNASHFDAPYWVNRLRVFLNTL